MKRNSDIQKQTIQVLAALFVKGFKQVELAELRKVVAKRLDKDIHGNNFRKSCETLEERGLIVREKPHVVWHVKLTAEGFDLAMELEEAESEDK
ncbi:hypothetical protein [Enterovibrio norvegicus]|uniref:hypothetical protein n=1 Tax=Enterovibrio norvegicus TaxID=188144 RepID=UPI000C83E8EC|nr:hypothetical protein [Enterovibrio norvegicus]PMH64478.1 hypothetical protein BCU62_15600 [Enterovibrio norvegicus]